ncbi:LptF/LptG family permease [Candidatus Palauibacter sp.]|uniref:LptF/LptG family permease n=1 Tax=Candidatus Palauibacter sp. TaxID=3101350 RepID=UPI003AF2B3F6
MRTLTRYILRLHLAPFLFAASGLTVLLLLDQVSKRFERLIGKGLHWSVIVEVFVYSIPFIIAQTLPMAVLIAVLYVFSRLEGDFEVTAIKASGIPLTRVMAPLLVCAVILAGAMTWFNNAILPQSNHHLQVLLTGIGRKKPTFNLREQTINEVIPSRLYVHPGTIDQERSEIEDVRIYDERDGQQSHTIYAARGKMAFEEGGEDLYFDLEDGVMQIRPNQRPYAFRRVAFEHMTLRIPDVGNALERDTMGAVRGDREMNIAEMREEAHRGFLMADAARAESETYARAITRQLLDFRQPVEDGSPPGTATGATAGPEVEAPGEPGSSLEPATEKGSRAVDEIQLDSGGDPDSKAAATGEDAAPDSAALVAESAARRFYTAFDAANQFEQYADRELTGLRRVNQFWVEIHKKGTIPAACIVFVLIGATIAVRFPRGGVALVVGVSLVCFGAYYVFLIVGEDLSDRLWVSPLWAMWAPNILFGLFGMAALWRSTRVTR